jgi:serine/threonine protein phosphatase PrpC
MTYGKKIFLANVGDSRAIILRVKNECKIILKLTSLILELVSDPLTRDHKPDDPEEAQRIFA